MKGDPSTLIQLDCLDWGTENQISCRIGELSIWNNADSKKEVDVEKELQGVTEQEKQKGMEEIQKIMCAEEAMERVRLMAEVNPSLSAMIGTGSKVFKSCGEVLLEEGKEAG